jgi:hypothetical protein
VGFPAEERAVKTLGGVLVGGVEFNPAEGTGGMLIDVCHGGESVHQIGPMDCQREMKAAFTHAEIAIEFVW